MKVIFSLGIGVIGLILIIIGMNTFYERPECFPLTYPRDATSCVANGGVWITTPDQTGRPMPPEKETFQPYCDFQIKCEQVQNIHSRNTGIAIFIIAFIFIVVGLVAQNFKTQIKTGFVIAGLLNIIYGIVVFWSNLTSTFRFLVILLIFIVLIYIANKFEEIKGYFK